jgi:hypothetical protein
MNAIIKPVTVFVSKALKVVIAINVNSVTIDFLTVGDVIVTNLEQSPTSVGLMAGVNAMSRASVRVGQMLKENVVIVVKKDRLPYPQRTRAVVLNVSVLEKPQNANSRLWFGRNYFFSKEKFHLKSETLTSKLCTALNLFQNRERVLASDMLSISHSIGLFLKKH